VRSRVSSRVGGGTKVRQKVGEGKKQEGGVYPGGVGVGREEGGGQRGKGRGEASSI